METGVAILIAIPIIYLLGKVKRYIEDNWI